MMRDEFYGLHQRLWFEPRCQVGVALGVAVAGAAVAAGASAYSASEQAGAAKDANEANISEAERTRRLQYNQNLENRGSKGSALLPGYAKDSAGNPIEPQLFADTLNTYYAAQGAAPTAAGYQTIAAGVAPAQAGAVAAVNNLYNGQSETQQIANQAPVGAARLDSAKVARSSALEALAATNADIKAINDRKGFAGGGFDQNLLNFEARRQAYGAGAGAIAGANLANAGDVAGIKNNAIASRLSNTGLPLQVASTGTTLANLPADALTREQISNQSLFGAYRMAPSTYIPGQLPERVPIPTTGQIVGTGVSQLASSVGNAAVLYGVKQQGMTPKTPDVSNA